LFQPDVAKAAEIEAILNGCFYLMAGNGQYLGTYPGDRSISPPVY